MIFASTSLLFAGVWYLKTYFFTGNPFYPFLQDYLGGPEINTNLLNWPEGQIISTSNAFQHLKNIPLSYLNQFYYFLSGQKIIRGHISPVFIAIIPLIIFSWRRESFFKNRVLIVIGLFYLYWIAFYPFVRIGLPLFTLFSIVTAFTICKYVSDGYFL